MPRTRTNYSFISDVNSVITGTIDEGDYNTAIKTWCKDSWDTAVTKIRAEDANAIYKYEILANGRLNNIDLGTTFADVATGEAYVGLDHFPDNIKTTLKNRNDDNLCVYYGDATGANKAFVITGKYLWYFRGDDSDALDLLKDGGIASVKYYGAAYAEPSESVAHNNSGDAVIEGHLTE